MKLDLNKDIVPSQPLCSEKVGKFIKAGGFSAIVLIVSSFYGGIFLTSPFPQPAKLIHYRSGETYPEEPLSGTFIPFIVSTIAWLVIFGKGCFPGVRNYVAWQKDSKALKEKEEEKDIEKVNALAPFSASALNISQEQVCDYYSYFGDADKTKFNFMQISAVRDRFPLNYENDLEQKVYSEWQLNCCYFLKHFKDAKDKANVELQAQMLLSRNNRKLLIHEPHLFEMSVQIAINPYLFLPIAAEILRVDFNNLEVHELDQLKSFIDEIFHKASLVDTLLSSCPSFLPKFKFLKEENVYLLLPCVLVEGFFPEFDVTRCEKTLPDGVDEKTLKSYFDFQIYGNLSLDSLQSGDDFFTSKPYIFLKIANYLGNKEIAVILENFIENYFKEILKKINIVKLFRIFKNDELNGLCHSLQNYYLTNHFISHNQFHYYKSSDFFLISLKQAYVCFNLEFPEEKYLKPLYEWIKEKNFSVKGEMAAKQMIGVKTLLDDIKGSEEQFSKLGKVVKVWIGQNPEAINHLYTVSCYEKDSWLQELIESLYSSNPEKFPEDLVISSLQNV